MKALIDSSSLIALTKVGCIDLLRKVFGNIYITEEIRKEAASGNTSDALIIKENINNWIKIVKPRSRYYNLKGLNKGEQSLLAYAKENKDCILILDEVEARTIAESEGFSYTGTLGLLVFAYETKKITKNEVLKIIKKLARSDFRMTVELYDWALEKIEK